MKWLLVMIVAGVPVKTDLTFATLRECLQAEQQVAAEYAKAYNEAISWAKATQPAKDYEGIENLARTRSHRGTCIPTSK